MSFDPVRYWEERHVKFAGDHRNVGNAGLTSAQNFELLIAKAVMLSHALGRHCVAHNAAILDAGCGAGVVTEFLRLGGFRMSGFDYSPSAIAAARVASQASFEVSGLDDYRATAPFDVVMCNDVLFHVVDDAIWRASLVNLVRAVRPSGLFFIIEQLDSVGGPMPPHVRWRDRSTYERFLAEEGLSLLEKHDFQYPNEGSPKTLLIARKSG